MQFIVSAAQSSLLAPLLERAPFNPPDGVGWFMVILALALPLIARFYLSGKR